MTDDVESEDVQRNGFELFEDRFSIPPGVIETFLDKKFDPERTFAANAREFWVWLADPAAEVVTECPVCGEPTDGAEVTDGEIIAHPCGHVISEVDEDEIPT